MKSFGSEIQRLTEGEDIRAGAIVSFSPNWESVQSAFRSKLPKTAIGKVKEVLPNGRLEVTYARNFKQIVNPNAISNATPEELKKFQDEISRILYNKK